MGQTLFFIAVGMWILVDLYVMLFLKKEQKISKKEKKSKYIIIVMIITGMLVPPFLMPGTKEAFLIPFQGLRYFSVIFIVTGTFLRILSIFQLGTNFSDHLVIENGKTLHVKGLYQWIRHPSYLGEILNFLGVAIAYYVWYASLFAFIIPTIAFLYRIEVEEKMLLDHFGKHYQDYQKTSKKLSPYIY